MWEFCKFSFFKMLRGLEFVIKTKNDQILGSRQRNKPKNENFKNHFEENMKICLSQMAKNAPKLSTMVRENFEIHFSQMAKNAPRLSIMVGENFEFACSNG